MIFDPELNQVIGFGGKNYRYVMQDNTFTLNQGKVEILDRKGL